MSDDQQRRDHRPPMSGAGGSTSRTPRVVRSALGGRRRGGRRGGDRSGGGFLGVFSVRSERASGIDWVIAGIATLTLIVTALTVLMAGSAHRSSFEAAAEQKSFTPLAAEPGKLELLWHEPTAMAGAPLVTKGNVVTVDEDGTLVGRDAGKGPKEWSYQHPGGLCGAAFYSDSVVAAYRGAKGCSDVTALNPATQVYSSSRQSAFGSSMTMWHTWGHALVQDSDRVEIWRSDLVRTVEYGHTDAPQESGMQPRSGCQIDGAGLSDERFAVSERCPGDASQRLTISKTDPKDSRKPEEVASDVTGAEQLGIIAVGSGHVLALQKANGTWSVEKFTSPTQHQTLAKLDAAPAALPTPETVSADNSQVRWFDGNATRVFSVADGRLAWTAKGVTGPGIALGYGSGGEQQSQYDWTMMPNDKGWTVHKSSDGTERRGLEIQAPARGPAVTGMSQVGDILYETRAGEVYAYKITKVTA